MPYVSDYTILPPDPNPDGGSAFPEVYQAKSKSYFLASMISSLRALGLRLYPLNNRGSVVHRFLDSIALELAILSRAMQDAITQAVLRSAYLAHGIVPGEATFATGVFRFVRKSPAPTDELIPANTILGSISGRTAVTLMDVTVLAGQSVGTVPIRSETAGTIGNAPAGDIQTIISSVPGNYQGSSNPTPLSGGTDGENQIALFARFQALQKSRRVGTPDYILAQIAGLSVTVSSVVYTVRNAVVIRPWQIPQLGLPPGTFYLILESGGGIAPIELVNAAQVVLNSGGIVSAGNAGIVESSVPYQFNLSANYSVVHGAIPANVEAKIQALWGTLDLGAKIEDGSGSGELDVGMIVTTLQSADPSLTFIGATASTPVTIKPSVAAIVQLGTLTLTLAS